MNVKEIILILIFSFNYNDIYALNSNICIKLLICFIIIICSILNFGIISFLFKLQIIKKYNYNIKEAEKYIMIFSNILKNGILQYISHNTKNKTSNDVYRKLEENIEDDKKFKKDDKKFKEDIYCKLEDDKKFKEDIINLYKLLKEENESLKKENAKLKEKIRNLEKKNKKKRRHISSRRSV